MKKRLILVLALVLVLSFSLVPAVPVGAADPTTIASSIMTFEGDLTDNGDGTYSGTIPLVNGAGEEVGDGEDGFDNYARNGAMPFFTDERGLVTPALVIADHDAYPEWLTDVPDWDYYALTLTADSWSLVYCETIPNWESDGAVPMSGTMDWNNLYAAETDVGYCFGNLGIQNLEGTPGLAADNGGGAACWDMDWIWGSEVVPLAFPGFAVSIDPLGGDSYRIAMTPAAGDNPPGPVVNEDSGESYGAIQAAIDAPETEDYHTISVAAETYNENVVVDKALTLQGATGATIAPVTGVGVEIQVSTVTVDNFVINTLGLDAHGIWINVGATGINITDNNITIGGESTAIYADAGASQTVKSSGWTISGNTLSSPAGCNLELYDVDAVTVDDNIFKNAAGSSVIVSSELFDLTGPIVFTNNDVQGNDGGSMVAFVTDFQEYIWTTRSDGIDTSIDDVTITGNTFDGWASRGLRIGDWGGDVTNVVVNYNNFLSTGDALVNNDDVALDATNNWWGTTVESEIAAMVSGNVDYNPWFGAGLEESESETVSGPATISETPTGGDVTIDATGEHTITTAKYEENPGGSHAFEASGNYYDVHLDDETNVSTLTVEFCPATESTIIYYWDGSNWIAASEQTYGDGCIVVTITASTDPSLSDLAGLPFAAGGPPPVGGTVFPLNKLALLAPWIVLGLAVIAGAIIILRRRRAWS